MHHPPHPSDHDGDDAAGKQEEEKKEEESQDIRRHRSHRKLESDSPRLNDSIYVVVAPVEFY